MRVATSLPQAITLIIAFSSYTLAFGVVTSYLDDDPKRAPVLIVSPTNQKPNSLVLVLHSYRSDGNGAYETLVGKHPQVNVPIVPIL